MANYDQLKQEITMSMHRLRDKGVQFIFLHDDNSNIPTPSPTADPTSYPLYIRKNQRPEAINTMVRERIAKIEAFEVQQSQEDFFLYLYETFNGGL